MRSVVSILTDFGTKDPYVAEIKAVILSYRRDAVIIDLTHEISAFNELEAAFILKISAPYMPDGTIHICVVDPGVGSERRSIAIKTQRGDVFIGPDTGIMIPAAEQLGIEFVYFLDVTRLPPRKSETFHGRDVFAHAAGMLAAGKALDEIGVKTSNYAKLDLPKPRPLKGGIEATVMHIDRFGNLITNVAPEKFFAKHGSEVLVKIRDEEFKCRYVKSYAYVPVGSPLLTEGGTGYVELSINRGNAASRFDLKPGDKIILLRPTDQTLE